MDKKEKDFVEEIIGDAKNGLLKEITWLDLATGIGYGLGAFFIVTVGYISHQADRRSNMKLLVNLNNKEEN